MAAIRKPRLRLFSMSMGVRVYEPILDIDGRQAPIIGYYRTFLVCARSFGAAAALVEREISDGVILECDAFATRHEMLSRPVAAKVPSAPRKARVVWRSGHGFFQDSGSKPSRGRSRKR